MGFSAIAAGQLDLYVGRNGYLLLDVRPEAQYLAGHIRGARNIPYARLKEEMAALPKDRVLVCYCEHGGASLKAARELSLAGFEAVSAAGGLDAYHGKYFNAHPMPDRSDDRRRF